MLAARCSPKSSRASASIVIFLLMVWLQASQGDGDAVRSLGYDLEDSDFKACSIQLPLEPGRGTFEQNVENISRVADEQLKQAAKRGCQLAVLPEGLYWSFTPFRQTAEKHAIKIEDVTDSSPLICPCSGLHTDSVLCAGSRLASENKLYVVASFSRSKATPNGTLLLNTAIAFRPDGCVSATYDKIHSYGNAPPFDEPYSSDPSFFTMPSGIRVGMMVCFDVEFREPALSLKASEVDLVVMPSWWVNTPPLSWSVLYHAAWARHFRLPLAAANAAEFGSVGSGVYGADGRPLGIFFDPLDKTPGSKVVLAHPFEDNETDVPTAAMDGQGGISQLDAGLGPGPGVRFNCSVPFYGQGMCSRVMQNYSGPINVVHGKANCSFSFTGGSLTTSSRVSNWEILMGAWDVTLFPGGTKQGLHLLHCAVFQCQQVQHLAATEADTVECAAQYPISTIPVGGTVSQHLPEGEEQYYLPLPLVADGNLNPSDPSRDTQLIIQSPTDEGGDDGLTSVSFGPNSISTVDLFSVDQRTTGGSV